MKLRNTLISSISLAIALVIAGCGGSKSNSTGTTGPVPSAISKRTVAVAVQEGFSTKELGTSLLGANRPAPGSRTRAPGDVAFDTFTNSGRASFRTNPDTATTTSPTKPSRFPPAGNSPPSPFPAGTSPKSEPSASPRDLGTASERR